MDTGVAKGLNDKGRPDQAEPVTVEEGAEAKLAQARAGIRELDRTLTDLLIERAGFYAQVAEAKAELNQPIKNDAVEAEKLAALADRVTDVDQGVMLAEIYRSIMRQARIYQYRYLTEKHERFTARSPVSAVIPNRVRTTLPAYKIAVTQGTDSSHAAKAAGLLFPEATLLHTKTFANAACQVTDAIAPVAVLPLENTTAGTVDEVYHLLEREPLYIVRSLDLPIHHRLCVLPGTKFSAIRRIISHPQALAQCSVFTQTMGWETEEIQNTAFAAAKVKTDGQKQQAALASPEAAKAYGLAVLPTEIANEGSNTTRFIALSTEPVIAAGADTLTLICRLSHRRGSLANLLALLETYDLNLKKILSRPVPGKPWEYSFYLDIETAPLGAGADLAEAVANTDGGDKILAALAVLPQELEAVRLLGWYRQEQAH